MDSPDTGSVIFFANEYCGTLEGWLEAATRCSQQHSPTFCTFGPLADIQKTLRSIVEIICEMEAAAIPFMLRLEDLWIVRSGSQEEDVDEPVARNGIVTLPASCCVSLHPRALTSVEKEWRQFNLVALCHVAWLLLGPLGASCDAAQRNNNKPISEG